jgi:hypothetical protein
VAAWGGRKTAKMVYQRGWGRRPRSKQADGPCRAIEIVTLTGQLYATGQLTPDRGCTRYSKSVGWSSGNYGSGADEQCTTPHKRNMLAWRRWVSRQGP